MLKYNFSPPYDYKDWYIFPNTVLNNIYIDDCTSSVTGKCENTQSIQQCIQICENNQPCEAGYFIQTPDRKNICIPLKKHSDRPLLSTYYRLRDKNTYPILKNMKSSVFTTQEYKFPPNHTNNIFYTDKFVLTNITSDKSIGISGKKLTLSDNPAYLQFLPKEIQRTKIEQYHIIKNGDEVVINIPDTSYVLQTTDNYLSWIMKVISLEKADNTFRIFTHNKKIGEYLHYTDNIYFTNGNPVIYNSEIDNLIISSHPEISKEAYFKIIPKIEVYYCDNKQCKNIKLEETETNGQQATYKGSIISRNSDCWGLCNNRNNKKNELRWLWVIIIIFIIIVLFIAFRRLF